MNRHLLWNKKLVGWYKRKPFNFVWWRFPAKTVGFVKFEDHLDAGIHSSAALFKWCLNVWRLHIYRFWWRERSPY